MMKKIARRTLRIARGTALAVGAAVMMAVVLGVTTTALAGTEVGATFNLGKANTVDAVSRLVGSVTGSMLIVDNNGAGTALDLRVGPATTPPDQKTAAPMKVDSQARVDNLNADELDNKSASDFLAADGKAQNATHADQADSATNTQNAANAQNATAAQNADKLDGKDSSEFATKSSEAWRQITTTGTNPYNRFYAGWTNFDGEHSTAAYYKDSQGIVHLKGVVRSGSFYDCCYNTEDGMIFLLPQGYWPSEHRVFTTLSGSNTSVGRIDIGRGGCYGTQNLPSGTCGAAVQAVAGNNGWISLDGISFRAEG